MLRHVYVLVTLILLAPTHEAEARLLCKEMSSQPPIANQALAGTWVITLSGRVCEITLNERGLLTSGKCRVRNKFQLSQLRGAIQISSHCKVTANLRLVGDPQDDLIAIEAALQQSSNGSANIIAGMAKGYNGGGDPQTPDFSAFSFWMIQTRN